MLDVLYTFCQLLAVLALAYGAFLVIKSPRTFHQALELSAQAQSNHYAAIDHSQLKREKSPVGGRREQGPRASGGLNGLRGAAA